jgi:hypothetical protein
MGAKPVRTQKGWMSCEARSQLHGQLADSASLQPEQVHPRRKCAHVQLSTVLHGLLLQQVPRALNHRRSDTYRTPTARSLWLRATMHVQGSLRLPHS